MESRCREAVFKLLKEAKRAGQNKIMEIKKGP